MPRKQTHALSASFHVIGGLFAWVAMLFAAMANAYGIAGFPVRGHPLNAEYLLHADGTGLACLCNALQNDPPNHWPSTIASAASEIKLRHFGGC